ncbi:hypothetical protein ABI59_19135 [Acidobacteria bacterium Mor1]|nr:hypothetical protein ABI59_19135 [Acidobacteria bacterium Mor1]
MRPLEARDLPELECLCREHARFERADWGEGPREQGLYRWFLGEGTARCWVVEADPDAPYTLAGFASANLELSTWDAASYAHLDCLYLREPYRRRGFGRALLARVADYAQRNGAVNLQWQTPEWNVDAIRFYRRVGATSSTKLRFRLDPGACRALADS